MNNDHKEQDDSKLGIDPIEVDTIQVGAFESGKEENANAEHDVEQQTPATDNISGVLTGIGHQLRAARLAYNLSIDEVAHQLRLSVRQVEAMEKEEFEKLPSRTFLKGFIRNYANLVHLDAAAILQLLPSGISLNANSDCSFQAKTLSATTNLVWRRSDFKFGDSNRLMFRIIGVISLLLVITYIIFRFNGSGQVSGQANETETNVQLEIGMVTEPGQVGLNLPLQLPQRLPATLGEANNLTASSQALPAPSPADGKQAVIHLEFARESRVEIKDGANNIIFKQTNASGTEQMIKGKRPLSFVIGEASHVNLNYNNRLIDLVPYTNDGGIARLTLE